MTINFKAIELQNIFKIGDGINDIEEANRYYDSNVANKIKLLKDKFPSFLEYQMKDNPLKWSFYYLVHNKSSFKNWLKDEELRISVKEWVADNHPVRGTLMGMCYQSFYRLGQHDYNFDLDEYIKYFTIEEKKEILKFCLTLCEESIYLHRINCSRGDCGTEIAFTHITMKLKNSLKQLEGADSTDLTKMQWNGTQKQLAELFIELKKNGWIEGFENATIKACFTKSNTIQQVLKPSQDSETYEANYDEVYTPNYSPKFHGIMENKKK